MNHRRTKLTCTAALVGITALVGLGTGLRPAAAVTLHPAVPHAAIMDDVHDWRWHRDHDRDNSYNWRWHRDHDSDVRVYHYHTVTSHVWYSPHSGYWDHDHVWHRYHDHDHNYDHDSH